MKMRDEHTDKINIRRNVDMKIRNLLAALLVISLCICLPVQVSAMGAPVELTVEKIYTMMIKYIKTKMETVALWEVFRESGTVEAGYQ